MRRPRTGNRTDLPAPLTTPAAPTGLPYGEAGALRQSQQVVPLNAPQQQAAPGPQPSPQQQQPTDPNAVLQAARGMAPPDQTLNAPTGRPGESITTGLMPNQANVPVVNPTQSLGQMLQQLAMSPSTNPEVQFLSQYVNGGRL